MIEDMPTYAENAIHFFKSYALQIVYTVLVFFLCIKAGKIIEKVASYFLKKTKLDQTITTFVTNSIYFLAVLISILITLRFIGVQSVTLVTAIGTIGLAIGLALQGSLSNLASGVLIIWLRPFKAGDWINAGGVEGTVESINIITTILRTGDNKEITIPNTKIMGDSITNFSKLEKRRLDIVLGIAYGESFQRVRKVLLDMIQEDERYYQDPEPNIFISNFGASSVDISFRVWVKTENYWPVFFQARSTIYSKFNEHNIEIPFSQMDLHVKELPENSSLKGA